jgi:hypothetical protein
MGLTSARAACLNAWSSVLILPRHLLIETRGMRHIGSFELGAVCGTQPDRKGGDGIGEVPWLGGTDDGSGDSGTGE